MDSRPVPLPNLAATQKLAAWLAQLLRSRDTLALQGELGAGKTTFARALLEVIGVEDDVPSPTFTLLQNYETPHLIIAHFDLYRLKSAEELDELGWDDILAENLSLIEWPERAENRLPHDRLTLHFSFDADGQRQCAMEPSGTWVQRLKDKA